MPIPKIILGVDAQPIENFDKVKALGANTVVRYDSGPQKGIGPWYWVAKANEKGLASIIQYSALNEEDIGETDERFLVTAFAHDDEPDRRSVNPATLKAGYDRIKARENKPVFVNFSGSRLTNGYYTHGRDHKPYIEAADWVGFDWHVRNEDYSRYPINLLGVAVDRLREWGGNKPVLAYFEASDQVLDSDPVGGKGRGPTPAEVSTQIWHCLAHGAKGVIAFPQRIKGGFSYWAMTEKVEDQVEVDFRFIETHADLIASGSRRLTTDREQKFYASGARANTWDWAGAETAVWEKDGEILKVSIDLTGSTFPSIEHVAPEPAPAPPRLKGLIDLHVPGFKPKVLTIDTELEPQ